MKVAIAGNPNCGKTSLFNGLTGAHQRVGNYPGVTVEKKSGHLKIGKKEWEFVDLPGTYGLSAYSLDEMVARGFLIEEKPDLILNVVDASNLERNLYLTAQLLELEIPLILVLNMMDTAKSRGLIIDKKQLSELLHIPVMETIGNKWDGLAELLSFLEKDSFDFISSYHEKKVRLISFGLEIDDLQRQIVEVLKPLSGQLSYPLSWMAIKLIERDQGIWDKLHSLQIKECETINQWVLKLEKHIEVTLDDFVENVVSSYRYGFVNSLCTQTVDASHHPPKTVSDYLDAIFLNRFFGPLVLLGVLWGFYQFVFTLGEPLVALLEKGIVSLHNFAEFMIPPGLIQSLITSGMIDGVGGVLGFTPLIMLMFLLISILEDSGYMARIAFLLDRVLRTFGMHGNSILAFIVSGGIAGGCAVPGIMATRTLKDPKERLATILTAPFMNCGAKLPVFSVLIAAFFPENRAAMMFLITLLSWFFALIIAGLLRKTILKGSSTPFVMELPPYRFPTWKGVFIHMWERTWMYIRKAGTFILMASILMWVLMTFPIWNPPEGTSLDENQLTQQRLYHSVAGVMGRELEKVTGPLMGFDWQTNIALVAGIAAKEVVVSTMGIAYSLGAVDEEDTTSLSQRLAQNPNWNPIKAFALIIFVMLYIPCISVLGVMSKETGSWGYSLFSIFYTSTVAILFSSLFYQVCQWVL